MAALWKLGLDREGFVKTNLIQTLVDCIKELQLKHVAERSHSLTNDEPTNALCFCLEAMFIHGLKNTFVKSMSSVLHNSQNQIPQPSFWEFVLIFCHQDVIRQINLFRNINTDIGRCRAWLRLILNDGLLISYFQLIMSDKRMLKEYYKPSAFLRDSERCDLAKSYLFGLESYSFELVCNSSLLNSWNSTPLSLVGLWTPPDTVAQGVDVAGNMEATDLQALPNLKLQSESDSPPKYPHLPLDSPFGRAPLLEEDEALRLILSSKGSTLAKKSRTPSSNMNDEVPELSQNVNLQRGFHVTTAKSRPGAETVSNAAFDHRDGENNLEVTSTASSSIPVALPLPKITLETSNSASRHDENAHAAESGTNQVPDKKMRHQSDSVQIPSSQATGTPQDEGSYAALFQSYSRSDSVIGTPIGVGSPVTIGSFLQSASFLPFQQSQAQTTASSEPSASSTPFDNHRSSSASDGDFVAVDTPAPEFTDATLELPDKLRRQIQTIPNESGLDAQNYRCKECNRPIGMLYGAASVCGFSGNYYCGECHLNDESVIPSRILMNWDFSRFGVSCKARDFLSDISNKPIFDLDKINPKLYQEVEECSEVLKLRTQLNAISLYLLTCKEPQVQEVLTKEFWMRDHLYLDLHKYSISDLLGIPNRQLQTTFAKVVAAGSEHIKSCDICRLKGFICEVCRDNEVIFPFELESIYKCILCGAVYHSKCMNNNIQCPRCDRWKFA